MDYRKVAEEIYEKVGKKEKPTKLRRLSAQKGGGAYNIHVIL